MAGDIFTTFGRRRSHVFTVPVTATRSYLRTSQLCTPFKSDLSTLNGTGTRTQVDIWSNIHLNPVRSPALVVIFAARRQGL